MKCHKVGCSGLTPMRKIAPVDIELSIRIEVIQHFNNKTSYCFVIKPTKKRRQLRPLRCVAVQHGAGRMPTLPFRRCRSLAALTQR